MPWCLYRRATTSGNFIIRVVSTGVVLVVSLQTLDSTVVDSDTTTSRLSTLCARFPHYHRIALERLTRWPIPAPLQSAVDNWYVCVLRALQTICARHVHALHVESHVRADWQVYKSVVAPS
jgi:hypothetical protein